MPCLGLIHYLLNWQWNNLFLYAGDEYGLYLLCKMFDFDPLYIFSLKNSNSCLSLSGEEGEVRSVLQEQSTALGLSMFALLVQRCTELLKDTAAGTHTVTSTSSHSVQVWISSMYQSCGNTLRFMYFEIKVNISI